MKNRVEVMDDDAPTPTVTATTSAKPAPPTAGAGDKAHKCEHCGKTPSTLKRCGACKSVYFCSVECQRGALKTHRDPCRTLQRAREEEKAAKKETATVDDLWAKHETRVETKINNKSFPEAKKKAEPQMPGLDTRFDPQEYALIKQRRKEELLGVLLKGGDEFDVSSVLLSEDDLKQYRARGEVAHLIQAASNGELPLLVAQVNGATHRENLAAFRLMTRPDTGFPDGKYQLGVGNVVVFRSDSQDLTCADVVFCFDFCGFVISDHYQQRKHPDKATLHELWKTDVKFKKHSFK